MAVGRDNEIARARRAKVRKVRAKRTAAVLAVVAVISLIIASVSLYSSIAGYDIGDFFRSFLTIGSFPIELEQGTVISKEMGSRVLYMINGSSLINIAGSGAELLTYRHGISNPGLAASGNRAVVYSIGGKSYKIFNRTMMLHSGSLDNPAVSAAVTPSGRIAFLTSGEVYTAELAVYNRNCEKIFTWYGSDGFPVGVYPSSYGNDVAVLCVKSRDGVLYTQVTRIDLSSRKEENSFEVEGFPLKAFPDSDGIILFMDDRCIRCSNSGAEEASYSYNGRTVLDIRSDSGRNIAVAFGDNKRSEINSLAVFTRKLTLAGEIDYRSEIDDIWISGDRLFVLSRGRIDAFTHSGVLQEIYRCDLSSYSVVYYGGLLTFEPQFVTKLSKSDREEVSQ